MDDLEQWLIDFLRNRSGYGTIGTLAGRDIWAATGVSILNHQSQLFDLHGIKSHLKYPSHGYIIHSCTGQSPSPARQKKQTEKLPERIRLLIFLLARDIEASGPVRGDWPNYSKLGSSRHHCHLKKGHPTYVAVWSEDRGTISVEIIYAGTHEKTPY